MGAFAWNILLALIWVAVSGDISGAGLFTGFVLGYIILGLTLRELPVFAAYVRRVPKIFRFAGYFLKELIRSNLRVAWDVVTPTHYMKPAVIAVPLDARTEGEIALLANLISLTPGTLSLDVSSDRRVLYLHVMYLDDLDQTRAQIKQFEARVLELLREETS
ncbi:MAG: Na+/H+ antiporter subunit E [Alcanivoracaceae bacterium]|jgi:multicomponent Na+:H+ antiporter subunit E|nr:Na+/H+ antiporter subunit E [Alcanivoracaceae bacterium]